MSLTPSRDAVERALSADTIAFAQFLAANPEMGRNAETRVSRRLTAEALRALADEMDMGLTWQDAADIVPYVLQAATVALVGWVSPKPLSRAQIASVARQLLRMAAEMHDGGVYNFSPVDVAAQPKPRGTA